jgi:hypothetical protein
MKKNNDGSHEHAPIDSYFAPIPGGEVPETFSPFAPIPIPEDDGLPADLGPRFALGGNKRVLLALLKEIEETKDLLDQLTHVAGGTTTIKYLDAIDRLNYLRHVRREWLKP